MYNFKTLSTKLWQSSLGQNYYNYKYHKNMNKIVLNLNIAGNYIQFQFCINRVDNLSIYFGTLRNSIYQRRENRMALK